MKERKGSLCFECNNSEANKRFRMKTTAKSVYLIGRPFLRSRKRVSGRDLKFGGKTRRNGTATESKAEREQGLTLACRHTPWSSPHGCMTQGVFCSSLRCCVEATTKRKAKKIQNANANANANVISIPTPTIRDIATYLTRKLKKKKRKES